MQQAKEESSKVTQGVTREVKDTQKQMRPREPREAVSRKEVVGGDRSC